MTAFEGAAQDIRLALRTTARRPGFAAAAIVTLALGIGASTAIFSVAYGVSIRPLPYPEPERLVRIYEANRANGQLKQDVSDGAFQDWRTGASSIESAALFTKPATRFLATGEHDPIVTMSVSPAFFDVLGVAPLVGQGFKPEREYTRMTGGDEVILSHAAWQRLFGGRPDVVGQALEFVGVRTNVVMRVIGVMPASFAFAEPVDLWRPAKIVEAPVPRMLRNWRYDRVVARLRPGATIAQARAELETVATRSAREFPASNGGWSVTIESLHDSIVGQFGRATILLLAAVAAVLLVACLNVGGLLVARAVARERETSVRMALGAGSARLIRLWLAEAAVLGVAGGALGVLLAWVGVATLKAAAPPGIPRLEAVSLDLPALFAATISTGIAILVFTLAPLGRVLRREVSEGLRSGSAGAGDGRHRERARVGVTMAQCAGAAMLVVLALTLTRSFIKLTSTDLGWNASGVLSLTVSPPMPPELRRPWMRYVEWSDRLVRELEATPGILRAAITTEIPFTGGNFSTLARGRGKASGDLERWPVVMHNVTDGYFGLMGIRLVTGRAFADGDRFTDAQINWAEKAERGVAVVSESTARALWPGRSPLGESLWLPDNDNVTWREVVGVVEDVRFGGVGETPALHAFVPWTQHSTGRPRLLVKGNGEASALIGVVRDVVRRVEPGTGIDRIAPLDTLVARAVAQPRFTAHLVAAFGALALALAAVGIYGTLSFVVGARTREFGIRLALGASRSRITADVVRRGVAPAIAGCVVGLAAAVALARTFRALLHDVEPADTLSIAAGLVVVVMVAIAAALGPARRASRVDPVRALRAE